ncbi:MAG: hypothetical protein J5825_02530 [Lachnospiraceae bacterium]|nr:hypothetical protein [Lachnospiraceae bacterium]
MDYQKELEERIELLEEKKELAVRMTKKDYIRAGVFTLICLVLVILGAFLA